MSMVAIMLFTEVSGAQCLAIIGKRASLSKIQNEGELSKIHILLIRGATLITLYSRKVDLTR